MVSHVREGHVSRGTGAPPIPTERRPCTPDFLGPPTYAHIVLGLMHELFAEANLLVRQEAQLMLTTGSTRLAVSRGQQTWYHSTCYI